MQRGKGLWGLLPRRKLGNGLGAGLALHGYDTSAIGKNREMML